MFINLGLLLLGEHVVIVTGAIEAIVQAWNIQYI